MQENPIVAALQAAFNEAVQVAIRHQAETIQALSARVSDLQARLDSLGHSTHSDLAVLQNKLDSPDLEVRLSNAELHVIAQSISLSDLVEQILLDQDLVDQINFDEAINYRMLADKLDIARIAKHVDLSDLAGEVDLSDLAGEVDLSDLASQLDVSEVAKAFDLNEAVGEGIKQYFDDNSFSLSVN